MITILDLIGLFGVSLVVYAYFLLQTERKSIDDLEYSIYNLVGSALIILTLIWNFNLSSFVIEGFWVAISLLGVYRYYKKRH